ncbi:MAG: SUMF1/EgtB/PvdO family nonheme iron enzyme, partial [Verrucomicrobiales bacterium]
MREHAGLLAYQGAEADQLGFLLRPIQEYLAASFVVTHPKPEEIGGELATMFHAEPEDQGEVVRLAVKRSAGNAAFRTALVGGLLEGGLDGNDDVFLGRLVSMAREEAVPAFVEASAKEGDRWRKGRLLGFVRKFRTPELRELAKTLQDHPETKWHALEILAEPSKTPPEKGDLWVEQETGMCFMRVKAGSFRMGSETGGSDEKPVHEVRISKDYWLGKCSVSNGEYGIYLEAKRKEKEKLDDPLFWGDPRFNGEYQPGVGVSWDDAKAFCEWLREKSGAEIFLPTEAEWEYGCRAGSETKYCFGDLEKDLKDYAWFGQDYWNGRTQVAGVMKPNGWGL